MDLETKCKRLEKLLDLTIIQYEWLGKEYCKNDAFWRKQVQSFIGTTELLPAISLPLPTFITEELEKLRKEK